MIFLMSCTTMPNQEDAGGKDSFGSMDEDFKPNHPKEVKSVHFSDQDLNEL